MHGAPILRSDRSALIVIDDADLRETIAAVVGQLSNFSVVMAADLESARARIRESAPSVLVVAPRWDDRDVEMLLGELPDSDPGVVMIGQNFDVDVFLDEVEAALARVRASRTRISVL